MKGACSWIGRGGGRTSRICCRDYEKQVLRSRALRALGPHPLSPSPHTRRGGTKGQSRVPPLHIVERGTGGEDHGEGDPGPPSVDLPHKSATVCMEDAMKRLPFPGGRTADSGMGHFHVSVQVGQLAGGPVARVQALVDTGATYTWIPRDVLEALGVVPEEEWPFVLADGREVHYPVAWISIG